MAGIDVHTHLNGKAYKDGQTHFVSGNKVDADNENELYETLSDYDMMIRYNPYFHDMKIHEHLESKEDLYHKATGHTVFDSVEGIYHEGMPVEICVMKMAGIDEQIEKSRERYEAYQNRFRKCTEDFTATQLRHMDRYFQNQMKVTEGLLYADLNKVVDTVKKRLYEIESRIDQEKEKADKLESRQRMLANREARRTQLDKQPAASDTRLNNNNADQTHFVSGNNTVPEPYKPLFSGGLSQDEYKFLKEQSRLRHSKKK